MTSIKQTAALATKGETPLYLSRSHRLFLGSPSLWKRKTFKNKANKRTTNTGCKDRPQPSSLPPPYNKKTTVNLNLPSTAPPTSYSSTPLFTAITSSSQPTEHP